MQQRRTFLKSLAAGGVFLNTLSLSTTETDNKTPIILPPALKEGDMVGLITPASSLFEARRSLISATEKMNALGFRVKTGKNIFKKNGYLAGSIQERLDDLHEMFEDKEVKAIITIRGGYGSGQLLPYIDYELIKKNPKIIIGYSDITSLLLAIHKKTGLITFHGPVAGSTYTDYTKKYFYETLMKTEPVGTIDDAPYESNLQNSSRILTINGGKGTGKLVGGNLTLLQATIGTPYEFDSNNAILFIEEVGEEPYNIDRILNHFKLAGKFEKCKGILFDKLPDATPAKYGASFYRNLSVEEVLEHYFKDYNFPVCIGFSIGHIKDKPTLPIGVKAELNTNTKKLTLLEAAVQ